MPVGNGGSPEGSGAWGLKVSGSICGSSRLDSQPMALSGGAARSQRRSGISASPVSNPAITTTIGALGFTPGFYHGNQLLRRESRRHSTSWIILVFSS